MAAFVLIFGGEVSTVITQSSQVSVQHSNFRKHWKIIINNIDTRFTAVAGNMPKIRLVQMRKSHFADCQSICQKPLSKTFFNK